MPAAENRPSTRTPARSGRAGRGVHLLAIAWAVFVTALLLTPGPVVHSVTGELAGEGSSLDKLVHAALFGVLGHLLSRSFAARRVWRPRLLALLVAAALGATIELVQPLVARDRDLWDAVANAAGAAIATFLQRA